MKVKYFATYNGPSYTSFIGDTVDGFSSVKEAVQSMRNRKNGRDWVNEYRQNEDGSYVLWATGRCADFQVSTNADYMDLHAAYHQNDGTYSYSDEIAYRLTFGERGGVIVE